MAPVLRALKERDEEVQALLALTGQHDELVDQVLQVFGMEPRHDLGIMRPSQDLRDVAHACLDGMAEIIKEDRPEMILVQGDTASVFFGALGAFFSRIPVGHVEAGLRSRHPGLPYPDPFPEETFRRLSGVLAFHHFAPTPAARDNLLREGVPNERVHVTGNTVVDALLDAADVRHEPENRELRRILAGDRRLVLLTAHRRESFGEPLRRVFRAVLELTRRHPDVEVLYPVHPNPQVQEPAGEILSGHSRISLTEPLGYLDMVAAMRGSHLVLTDSGGIQEEAPSFGVPVLVLREATERPEGMDAGATHLVGTDQARILEEASAFLGAGAVLGTSGAGRPSPFGDGRAGERIADIVVSSLTGSSRRTEDWTGA